MPRTKLKNLVVAYEPIWAIGTGRAATLENIFEMSTFIRRDLHKALGKSIASKIPILYGGSVDAKNAAMFVSGGGADGLLVGGASIKAKEFVKIIKEVAELEKI